jgi:ubiquinone biosynthesis protein
MILNPKYLPRLAAMVGLFTKYGLKDFAGQQGFLEFAHPEDAAQSDDEKTEVAERAAGFRKRLLELGPAYIKLGQMLSTRPDLLPPQYIIELEKLQDDVTPLEYEVVEEAIHEELGARLSKLFTEFEKEPLGSASLGQVHGATLRDGRSVIVKVQRPDIREKLAEDMEFFREVARFMTAHTSAGRRIDMVGVIQQLERALADELDYRVEARNAAMLRRSLAEFPRLLVPSVIDGYTTQKVLTMERVRGVKVTELPAISRIEHDFGPVADEFAKSYLKQITIDGHFHADPHPGNVFVVFANRQNPRTPSELVANERRVVQRETTGELSLIENEARREAAPLPDDIDVKLSLVDFGMTARLSGSLRDLCVRLLMDIADNRGDDAASTVITMGEPLESFDQKAFSRSVSQLVARNYDLSVGDVQMGRVLYEMINIAYQHGLRLPSELTLLAKALFNLDAVSRSLDPSYSPVEAIRDYTTRIANERARRDLTPRRIFQMATEATDLLSVLPHRVDQITARLAANELGISVDVPQINKLLNALQKIANRIFSGLVLTGLLVASAMIYRYLPKIATAGFVTAGIIGLYMVISILISDRRAARPG